MVDCSAQPHNFWYFVGLIATDGCLSTHGWVINLTSKDRGYLEDVRSTLQIPNRIGHKRSGAGRISYLLQMRNKHLYKTLSELGLTPRKSLTLGGLDVPAAYFADSLRGVIDGDGNIHTWVHPGNGIRQWALRIYSASPAFIRWLESSIETRFAVRGRLHMETRGARHPLHVLKFGKLPAQVILEACYYPECLAMPRKMTRAIQCVQTPNGVRGYGDVVAGVAKPEDARRLKRRGRKRPWGCESLPRHQHPPERL